MLPGLELTPLTIAALLLIGLVAGVLGGLLGVGGGLIMIPALLFIIGQPFGPGSLHTYKLASLASAALLSARAAQRHARAGAVSWPIVKPITLAALGGVLAGTALAALFADEHTHVLRRVFGGFMIAAVAAELWRARRAADAGSVPRSSCPTPAKRWRYGLLIGLPSGVISGLLGVGGGIWAVPAQNIGCGVRLQNAIANSSCMIVAVAAAAAITQSVSLAQMPDQRVVDGWVLAALLAPGAVLGGAAGAALTHRMHTRALRVVFYAILALSGLRLLAQ